MILLADSGSTKTDWCVADRDEGVSSGTVLVRCSTRGINPFFQTGEEIEALVRTDLLPQLPDTALEAVFFYGAGCTPVQGGVVKHALTRCLRVERPVEVASDMLCAARALCGKEPGIACILGTGSNSCFYNGSTIGKQVSPLGFILGDEGSGAHLGKTLVADLLKNQLPESLNTAFFSRFQLTPEEIIRRVYRESFPNRFLAGLSPFLKEHLSEPEVHQLVARCFTAFLRRNVAQYDYTRYPVHFVGSVAYHYQDVLRQVCQDCGMISGNVLQRPMEGLIAYHTSVEL